MMRKSNKITAIFIITLNFIQLIIGSNIFIPLILFQFTPYILGFPFVYNKKLTPFLKLITSWAIGLVFLISALSIHAYLYNIGFEVILYIISLFSLIILVCYDFSSINVQPSRDFLIFQAVSFSIIIPLIYSVNLIALVICIGLLGLYIYLSYINRNSFEKNFNYVVISLFISIISIIHIKDGIPPGGDAWGIAILSNKLIYNGKLDITSYSEITAAPLVISYLSVLMGIEPLVMTLFFPIIFAIFLGAIAQVFSEYLFEKRLEQNLFVLVTILTGPAISREVIMASSTIGYPLFLLCILFLFLTKRDYLKNRKIPEIDHLFPFIIVIFGLMISHHISFVSFALIANVVILKNIGKRESIILLIIELILISFIIDLLNISVFITPTINKGYFVKTGFTSTIVGLGFWFTIAIVLFLLGLGNKKFEIVAVSTAIFIITFDFITFYLFNWEQNVSSFILFVLLLFAYYLMEKNEKNTFFLTLFLVMFVMARLGDLTFGHLDTNHLSVRWLMYIAIGIAYFSIQGLNFTIKNIVPWLNQFIRDNGFLKPFRNINLEKATKTIIFSTLIISPGLFFYYSPHIYIAPKEEIDTLKNYDFETDRLIFSDGRAAGILLNYQIEIEGQISFVQEHGIFTSTYLFDIYNASTLNLHMKAILTAREVYPDYFNKSFYLVICFRDSSFNSPLYKEQLYTLFDIVNSATDYYTLISQNDKVAILVSIF